MNKDCICGYNRKDLNGFPPQHQREQPGLEYLINPLPVSEWGKNVENWRERHETNILLTINSQRCKINILLIVIYEGKSFRHNCMSKKKDKKEETWII